MGLRNLIVRISGDKSGLDSTLRGAETSLNSFGSVVKKVGGFIGVAFGVHAIKEFVVEASKAAAEAEGIANAFKKIGDTGFLNSLKEATRGQLGGTTLQRMAVQANNLNVPMKDLAMYLEFATKRAISTGKSISEMSDAIIMGVGRQSPRAFVQLGISVDEFNKKIKEANGDKRSGIKALAEDGLKKMGEQADTTAEKINGLSVAWKNFKKEIGKQINETGIPGKVSDALVAFLGGISGKTTSFSEKGAMIVNPMNPDAWVAIAMRQQEAIKKEQGQYLTSGTDWMNNPFFTSGNAQQKTITTLESLGEELKFEEETLQGLEVGTRAYYDQLKKVADLKSQIDLYQSGMANPAILRGAVYAEGAGTSGEGKWDYKGPQYNTTKLGHWTTDINRTFKGDNLLDSINATQGAVEQLATSFSGLFKNVNQGFDGMIKGAISGIERLVAELAAKAAILAILGVLFPEAAVLGGGQFMNFLFANTPLAGANGLGGDVLKSNISGKNIGISLRRSGR